MKKSKNGQFWLALVIFSPAGRAGEELYFNVFIHEMFHAGAEAISAMAE